MQDAIGYEDGCSASSVLVIYVMCVPAGCSLRFGAIRPNRENGFPGLQPGPELFGEFLL